MTDAMNPNRDDAARDKDVRLDEREEKQEERQTDRDAKQQERQTERATKHQERDARRDDTGEELHEGNGTELPPPDRRPSG